MTTSAYRFIAIPTRVATSVRTHMVAPTYGHQAHASIATGHGPCRHCLRTFRIGEEQRILFTYDAFAETESRPHPGPVFIHADACDRYAEDAGYPVEMRAHPVTLTGFGRGRVHRGEVHVDDGNVEHALEALFGLPGVDYVHVHDTAAGCYDLRVERAS